MLAVLCVELCGRESRRGADTCRTCYRRLWMREKRAEERARLWQDEYQWRDYVSLDAAQRELDEAVAQQWFLQQDA